MSGAPVGGFVDPKQGGISASDPRNEAVDSRVVSFCSPGGVQLHLRLLAPWETMQQWVRISADVHGLLGTADEELEVVETSFAIGHSVVLELEYDDKPCRTYILSVAGKYLRVYKHTFDSTIPQVRSFFNEYAKKMGCTSLLYYNSPMRSDLL